MDSNILMFFINCNKVRMYTILAYEGFIKI
jgi:hypothetical protein